MMRRIALLTIVLCGLTIASGAQTPGPGFPPSPITSVPCTPAQGCTGIANSNNITVGGNLTTGGALTFSGATATTFNVSGGTITVPNVTDTLAVLGTPQTFTSTPTFNSAIAITGTTLPTPAAGTLGLGGIVSAPTLGANGEGAAYLNSIYGAVIQGKGSTGDFGLANSTGSISCYLITGTQQLDCNIFVSRATTGTAPFVVNSTTNVANLNASSVNGLTFANTQGQLPAESGTANATAGKLGEFIQAGAGGIGGGTVTISIASPAVISDSAAADNTSAAAGITIGSVINFTTSGALPTGITAGTNYYVIAANFTVGTSYEISTTPGGTAVNTSGTQSGTQTRVNTAILANATAQDIAVVALTAGDWDCRANVDHVTTSTTTIVQQWLGTGSDSITGDLFPTLTTLPIALSGETVAAPSGTVRITVSGTTNYYLDARDSFSAGSAQANGTVQCRRVQ